MDYSMRALPLCQPTTWVGGRCSLPSGPLLSLERSSGLLDRVDVANDLEVVRYFVFLVAPGGHGLKAFWVAHEANVVIAQPAILGMLIGAVRMKQTVALPARHHIVAVLAFLA